MPTPYVFKTELELIQRLRDKKTLSAAKEFFSNDSLNIDDIVITGVAGNTFRAFRNLPVKPSVTFRNWAKHYIKQTFSSVSNLATKSTYSKYVHEATLSLCSEWSRLTGTEMGYGRGAKLFNLVLKRFACLQTLTHRQKKQLISLQHVPLDSYTIIGLRSVAPELSIPRNATMKYIETPNQYMAFQKRIATITKKASVPAIYYDILAWNMGH